MTLRFCGPAVLIFWSATAAAGFTDVLKRGTFLLDENFSRSVLENRYDDNGMRTTLIDPVKLYEPGSGLQGTLVPNAMVDYMILINQVQYGVTDQLTVGIGIPVVLRTKVDLDLQWIPGDFQPYLGRKYSEQDFWEWAESMGQPRPQDWEGNKGTLSDVILGFRYRFSDHIDTMRIIGLNAAFSMMGALPTGTPPPREELAGAGTTMWDLHSQGELCLHVSAEYDLTERLGLGVDAFYEFLFEHEYESARGTKNPLLMTNAPYTGDTYTLDPGDFVGFAVQLESVILNGPTIGTWLSGNDLEAAGHLPPFLSLSITYRFTYVGQSDWQSDSEIWDWEKEKLWRPGYKNTLFVRLDIGLLRIGVPLVMYVAYRNQSWMGGKNVRAADVMSVGIRIPAKLW